MKPQLISTRYPKSIKSAFGNMVLKPARNNKKLGNGVVKKGRWKGMPLFSVTLVERETCPSDCIRWDSCYGNNMPFAHRFVVNLDFYETVEKELKALSIKYPKGFVVRLHILGDFPHLEYVMFWRMMLVRFSQLHIYGYTAHNPVTNLGGHIDTQLNRLYPYGKCVIRFSLPLRYNSNGWRYASPKDLGKDSFHCPEQTEKTESCLTCAACWESTKTVFFEEH